METPKVGPKVSVVIPAYNSAAFIESTIESARNLHHDNIELIVVDDGSPDNTAQIVGAMEDVRLIVQANAGDSAARNTGLQSATGDYILFLDHDDLLLPEAFSHHLGAMQDERSFDMVFGSNYLINSNGEAIGENNLAPRIFSSRDVILGTTPSFSQCLYRRSALERIGGFRPEAGMAADHDLNIRLLGKAGRGFVHGGFVMKYRLHEGQQTKSPAKLFGVHMQALEGLLGPGGELEDYALLREARAYWQRYYGKFLPSEMARMLRQADFARAWKAGSLFVSFAHRSLPSAIGFWADRLRSKISSQPQAQLDPSEIGR
ncbi:MAG: glycosyltransferase [Erythrobacter sp.]|uniref:glycosyltransferase family 2 protein n=1 Tax=Erythrobacter sp. TaxID=1042 RepID=UPI00329815C7